MIDTSGDRFTIQVEDRECSSRTDAAHAIARWGRGRSIQYAPKFGGRDYGTLGQISSSPIHVETSGGLGAVSVRMALEGVPRSGFSVTVNEFLTAGVGLIQRLENRVAGIPTSIDSLQRDMARGGQELLDLAPRIAAPFKHSDALHDADRRFQELDRQLAEVAGSSDEPPSSVTVGVQLLPTLVTTARTVGTRRDPAPTI